MGANESTDSLGVKGECGVMVLKDDKHETKLKKSRGILNIRQRLNDSRIEAKRVEREKAEEADRQNAELLEKNRIEKLEKIEKEKKESEERYEQICKIADEYMDKLLTPTNPSDPLSSRFKLLECVFEINTIIERINKFMKVYSSEWKGLNLSLFAGTYGDVSFYKIDPIIYNIDNLFEIKFFADEHFKEYAITIYKGTLYYFNTESKDLDWVHIGHDSIYNKYYQRINVINQIIENKFKKFDAKYSHSKLIVLLDNLRAYELKIFQDHVKTIPLLESTAPPKYSDIEPSAPSYANVMTQ